MKCNLKAKCSKQEFLDNTQYSLKCKHKGEFTYGFYDDDDSAFIDMTSLLYNNIITSILYDWDVDGFVTFEK